MTNLELDIRARARGDIDGHTEYFEDRDPELAERFHGELVLLLAPDDLIQSVDEPVQFLRRYSAQLRAKPFRGGGLRDEWER